MGCANVKNVYENRPKTVIISNSGNNNVEVKKLSNKVQPQNSLEDENNNIGFIESEENKNETEI